jgi:hypothetical protein
MPMTPAARVIAEELRATAPGLREIAERLRQAEEQAAAWAKARKTIDRANAYRDGMIRTPAVPEAAPAPAAPEPAAPEPAAPKLVEPKPLGWRVRDIITKLPDFFPDEIPDLSADGAMKAAKAQVFIKMGKDRSLRDSIRRALIHVRKEQLRQKEQLKQK